MYVFLLLILRVTSKLGAVSGRGCSPRAMFGTYKTWVLRSGNELRPGPPPAFDSAEKAAELAEVINFPLWHPLSALCQPQ